MVISVFIFFGMGTSQIPSKVAKYGSYFSDLITYVNYINQVILTGQTYTVKQISL